MRFRRWHPDPAGQGRRLRGCVVDLCRPESSHRWSGCCNGSSRCPNSSLGLLLGFLFLIVWGAELIGLHGSLGALLFGASLSGLPYQVRREITPGLRSVAEGLFVPLFFASAGLQFSFSFVTLPVWTMVALALIPLFGNFVGAFIGAYLSRLTVPYAVASGLMGKGVAEIALLLVLWDSGVIDEVVFSFLVLVMFCYILFMPPVISFAVSRASRRPDLPDELNDIPQGIARFALDNITIDDILDRGRNHPDPSVTVRDFTDRWTMPNQARLRRCRKGRPGRNCIPVHLPVLAQGFLGEDFAEGRRAPRNPVAWPKSTWKTSCRG